jgi:hypothetical protein
VGTRNSLAPSGDELSKTGVSTSVKSNRPSIEVIPSQSCEPTVVVEIVSHKMRHFAPQLYVICELLPPEVKIAVLSPQILISLN